MVLVKLIAEDIDSSKVLQLIVDCESSEDNGNHYISQSIWHTEVCHTQKLTSFSSIPKITSMIKITILMKKIVFYLKSWKTNITKQTLCTGAFSWLVTPYDFFLSL